MADLNRNYNTFAQPAFKEELKEKACELEHSASYAWEQHKEVAHDAACMAASKSADFAKCAEAGFPASQSEGMIETAKEKLGGAVETVREKIGEGLGFVAEKMGIEQTESKGIPVQRPTGTFAQPAFKEELKERACELEHTQSYAWEQHKSVAQDAACMAASKSGDFAKCAEAGFPAPKDSEGMIEMAKEKLEEAAGTLSGAVETVREKIGEGLEFVAEKMGIEHHESKGIPVQRPTGTFAQPAFKEELKEKACELEHSTAYAWEQHKSVAQDAACMAASKSGDFAKCAAAGFPSTNESEGMMEIAKEKLEEGVEKVKEGTSQAYSSTVGTFSGAVETVREKIGEGLEYVAEKMKEAGEALTEKADETKGKGVELQKQAELNAAKINLKPI